MKNVDEPKILRRGNKTILIADDPDGAIARRIAIQLLFNKEVELAREDLKNNPLPERITQPIMKRIKEEREKISSLVNKKGGE